MSYLIDPYVVIVDWAECKIETRGAFLICEHTRKWNVKPGILDQEQSTGMILDLVARCRKEGARKPEKQKKKKIFASCDFFRSRRLNQRKATYQGCF
jgi:hypothetical protein